MSLWHTMARWTLKQNNCKKRFSAEGEGDGGGTTTMATAIVTVTASTGEESTIARSNGYGENLIVALAFLSQRAQLRGASASHWQYLVCSL